MGDRVACRSIRAPTSNKLEPPENPGRFTSLFRPASPVARSPRHRQCHDLQHTAMATGKHVNRPTRNVPLMRHSPGNPKAYVIVAATGSAPVADCGTRDARSIFPGTTADHADRAIARQPRRPVTRGTPITSIPAILRPLPDIAMHIVKAKFVRGETANGSRVYPLISALRQAAAARVRTIVHVFMTG